MKEILEILNQYGGLAIMAGLFVWTFYQDRTKMNKMLERIDKSNENILESIKAINKIAEALKEHILKDDNRQNRIFNDVEYIKEKVKK